MDDPKLGDISNCPTTGRREIKDDSFLICCAVISLSTAFKRSPTIKHNRWLARKEKDKTGRDRKGKGQIVRERVGKGREGERGIKTQPLAVEISAGSSLPDLDDHHGELD